MQKSLDLKLARILSDRTCPDFILADAKDADMGFGIAAPGQDASSGRRRSLDEYRQAMRENVAQGLLDIMLMSASTAEILCGENLFAASPITPAIRANDTSDIWLARGSVYRGWPSRPFRSATLDQALGLPGRVDLGLYSVTFNNDLERDHATLSAYRDFRLEAAAKAFRHFLEVFNPNAPASPIADVGHYINDMIARTLAGVGGPARPIFLKIAYNGPAAMEELCGYDSRLVVGILGGPAGTTFDSFHQLWEARKYGARAALYGRMISVAEHQPSLIEQLRAIADGHTQPAEAVRAYHGRLQQLKICPVRSLEDDLERTL
jgi:hypothetical protein